MVFPLVRALGVRGIVLITDFGYSQAVFSCGLRTAGITPQNLKNQPTRIGSPTLYRLLVRLFHARLLNPMLPEVPRVLANLRGTINRDYVPSGTTPADMKYTLTIEGGDASPSQREKIITESREGESERHMALKFLAYLLFSGETDGLPLRIEQKVDQRHTPDVVAADPATGEIKLWIDCGQIEPKRLERIVSGNRNARIVVVKATQNEMAGYIKAANRELPTADKRARVEYLSFDDAFVDTLASELRGTNTVSLGMAEDTMYLAWNGRDMSTEVYRQTG